LLIVVIDALIGNESTELLEIPKSLSIIVLIQVILYDLLVDLYSFLIATLFEQNISYPLDSLVLFLLKEEDHILPGIVFLLYLCGNFIKH
jgi:hypothetical protein